MDAREQRGLIIAATCRLKRLDNGEWVVPSQSGGEKTYSVNLQAKTCTCPDHAENGHTCKHYFAASFTFQRDHLPDGTVVETKSMTFTEKKTYTQDWPAYARAQRTEKARVQVLLHDLCRNLPDPDTSHKRGPKPHLVRDSVFAMVFKVYCGFSSRRFSTDLLEAHQRGFITKPIPGAKVTAFHENDEFTPILTDLIAKSAAPLAAVETEFAVDSSGFGSSRYERFTTRSTASPATRRFGSRPISRAG